MATLADLEARVRQYAYGAYPNDRPFESRVTEALDTTETGVDVTSGPQWNLGDILEVAETGEQMLVESVATNTLTVIRAYGEVVGTAATINGVVRKNPRFTYDQIAQAIKDTVNSLAVNGIHGFNTGAITLASTVYTYDIADTDIDENYGIISVYYTGTDYQTPMHLPFRQSFQLDTTDANWSTAIQVTLLSKGDRGATDDIYYTYAQSLKWDTDFATTLAKLAVEQEEIVVLGAVSRLFGMSIMATTQDPGARTDRTIQPGQTSRDGRWFQGEFFLKSRNEAARLALLRGRIKATANVRTTRSSRWRP